MNEDFYNIPKPQTPTTVQSNTTTTTQVVQSTTTQSFFDFSTILSTINTFLLAWTIFYAIVLVCDFFFYRVKFSDGEVSREKRGVKSLYGAFQLWVSYAFYLILFMAYLSTKNEWYGLVIGVFAVIYFIIKIIVLDLTHIPIVDKYAQKVVELTGAPFKLVGDAIAKAVAPTPPPALDKKK
jgi:purine-cytosine permease-like protein